MKRRVLVAQALVHKPPVIVLDEPTAGVDVELRQALWQFIPEAQPGRAHDRPDDALPGEAEALCERIAMLKQGRVVALDSTANLLKRVHTCFFAAFERRAPRRTARPRARQHAGAHILRLKGYEDVEQTLACIRRAAAASRKWS